MDKQNHPIRHFGSIDPASASNHCPKSRSKSSPYAGAGTCPSHCIDSVGVTSIEKGWLCEIWDAKEVLNLSNGLSSTGRSGRARNFSTILPAAGRSDAFSAQQVSIMCHMSSLQPRTRLKSCNGGDGLLPCCIAKMTLKSFAISSKGCVPENI